MPGLMKKLLICATADGLLLQPTGTRSADNPSIKIEYGSSNKITRFAAARKEDQGTEQALEAHGIIGLLNLVSSTYLISITRREQVAQVRDRPIYAIRDVTLIPLTSKDEAEKAISLAQKVLKQGKPSGSGEQTDGEESDGGEDAEVASIGEEKPEEGDKVNDAAALEPPKGALRKSATYVRDQAGRVNTAGFAKKWFSRGGRKEEELTREQERQAQEALPADADGKKETGYEDESKAQSEHPKEEQDSKPAPKQNSVIESLKPRILRGARLYFSSSGFFFSYEHDLSRSLAQRGNTSADTPLWKRFDELYFWNQKLMAPLIDAGHDSLVLPILQGFVGQRAFSIARTEGTEKDVVAEAAGDAEDVVKAQNEDDGSSKPSESVPIKSDFLLTLISRRSVKRAGLRYLRRGIDDDGYVANNVETEQILSSQSWSDSEKSFSLLQVRGSIPVFFSQSPYSFKPMPVMFGSETTNQTAFKKHFNLITKRYGKVQVASLVDKHGTELGIGSAYEQHACTLNNNGGVDGKEIAFEWFDFHSACKGMKFENVSLLMDILNPSLTSFGWLVKQNDLNSRLQTGILRTNCMDCLDRTNVVQSAVAGWALQQQLLELGMAIDLQTDPKTQWFNTLWADNGDAISRQYAGTSALKGDFTRTRKRNWTGALSDFSLTLNRYYNNIFGDYFLQTCIDYYLGNAGPAVFDEFETDMMGQDYALDMRQVRQSAIETCVKIVLEDPAEALVAGWTLSCPREANTLRSLPFEECVLLLTGAAVYFCRFDWETEKVGSFERVSLLDITEVWRGTYITSGLGGTHLDESKNVGFVLRFELDGPAVVRTNTRSLGNEEVAEEGDANEGAETDGKAERIEDKAKAERTDDKVKGSKKDEKESSKEKKPESRLLAFKALPPKTAAAKDDRLDLANVNEVDAVKHICDEIQKAMKAAWRHDRGFQHIEHDTPPEVQEKAVISVADARKSTGYVESLGYSLKKLVWS